jgi:hypothetical protein
LRLIAPNKTNRQGAKDAKKKKPKREEKKRQVYRSSSFLGFCLLGVLGALAVRFFG